MVDATAELKLDTALKISADISLGSTIDVPVEDLRLQFKPVAVSL